MFTTAGVPGRSAALDVCVASPNAAAARGDAAQASFDRKLSHHRDEISTVDLLSGRQTGDHTQPSHEHCSVQQTLHPAGMASRCRLNRSSADGRKHEISKLLFCAGRAAMTRAVQLNHSARAERLLEPFITGARVPLLTVALATTTTQTRRLTQQYQMTTMTSPPSGGQSIGRISAAMKLPIAQFCFHGAVCFRLVMVFS